MFFQKSTDDASVYKTSDNTCEDVTNTEEQPSEPSAYQTATDLLDIYSLPCPSENVISDTEDNEVHYIVCAEPTGIDMMLVVSDVSMREKDVINGRYRWLRHAVCSMF